MQCIGLAVGRRGGTEGDINVGTGTCPRLIRQKLGDYGQISGVGYRQSRAAWCWTSMRGCAALERIQRKLAG
jgi:hypothetical protein